MGDKILSRTASSRLAVAALWILKLLVAGAFGAAALLKLSGDATMVTEFGKIGLGQGFRYLTGILELLGVVLLLLPRTTFFGAVLLIGIDAGAFVAQLSLLHGDVIHVFVLGGLLLVIAWLVRPRR